MLRFDSIVFGPIRSRRLGSSLGVNLLPADGKICNFDCIYCECGLDRDGRTSTSIPALEDVKSALRQGIASAAESGVEVDSITFSGNGEPTLHPDFPEIIKETLALRDRFYPSAVVSVLSNATRLDKPEVVAALRSVDCPILKLDAVNDAMLRDMNVPAAGLSVDAIIDGMRRFEGEFVLQTMLLMADRPSLADDPEALARWMDIVRQLRPRLVTLYSLDRPAPVKGLQRLSAQQMQELVQPLINEGFNIKIY